MKDNSKLKDLQIKFDVHGHDIFIDFLKAYAVFMVVIGHITPSIEKIGYNIWGGVEVPIFILIQTFHVYKRPPKRINWRMVMIRIIFPFVFIQSIVWLLLYSTSLMETGYLNEGMLASWGGYGPGSYYPWIYLQMLLLIPLVRPLLERNDYKLSLILFVIISALIEIICSILHPDVYLYSKFFGRYFFLIFLGWIWVKFGVRINLLTLLLSVVSLAAVVYFTYFYVSAEPFFFTNISTPTHRWPCYPYMALLFICILYAIFNIIKRWDICGKMISFLSKCSYEIFIVQMVVCIFYRPSLYSGIEWKILQYLLWYVTSFILCFGGGYVLKLLLDKLLYITK